MKQEERPATLLAIDDDADIRKVLKANLELHGFNLHTADSLAAAQAQLDQQTPDLVLLDLTLPDGDGLQFCQRLKEKHPQLQVIMLTARDKVIDKVVGLETGADDYLVKPFETSELIARIRARLRQAGAAAQPQVEVVVAGQLRIDLRNHRVQLAGAEVALTPKEFQLLACLAERRDQLVSREDIRRRLWKESRLYSWSRVIDVHIQHIRQKIGEEHIVTVLGQGYRFQG